jgi:CBS domain-containing protein
MAQQIREIMPPNPVALPGTASVHEAARAMWSPILATCL